MPDAMRYCPSCGVIAKPVSRTRGSFGVELVLWLLCGFGLLYSLWRHTTVEKVCPYCGNAGLIPPDSPRAQSDPNRRILEAKTLTVTDVLQYVVSALMVVAGIMVCAAVIKMLAGAMKP